MNLDLIDRKLLYFLDINARQNIATLAKKLHIGRNVALYRINRLKEEGIILGSFVEINNPLLGYFSFRIFLKLSNYTLEQEKALFDFLKKQNNILWLSRVLGKWDLNPVFMTKNIKEFEIFRKELFLKFNSIIEDSKIALLTNIYYYPKSYLLGNMRKDHFTTILSIESESDYKADDNDEKLLALLSQDATISILDLSRKLRLSINTIKKRINNLEKHKIILGYRLFIDPSKLGYEYYKLHVTLRYYNKIDLNSLRAWLGIQSSVIYTDHYMDSQAFEVELHVKNEQEYIQFLKNLKKEFSHIIKDSFYIKLYESQIYKYLPT